MSLRYVFLGAGSSSTDAGPDDATADGAIVEAGPSSGGIGGTGGSGGDDVQGSTVSAEDSGCGGRLARDPSRAPVELWIALATLGLGVRRRTGATLDRRLPRV